MGSMELEKIYVMLKDITGNLATLTNRVVEISEFLVEVATQIRTLKIKQEMQARAIEKMEKENSK